MVLLRIFFLGLGVIIRPVRCLLVGMGDPFFTHRLSLVDIVHTRLWLEPWGDYLVHQSSHCSSTYGERRNGASGNPGV